MGLNIQWYKKLVGAILAGERDFDNLNEVGLMMYNVVDFDLFVEELERESLPLRIHQVRGDQGLPLTIFQWCLAFSDRFQKAEDSYHKFYEYCQKNGYKFKCTLDLGFLEKVELFMQTHELVLEYRQKQAA